jgi:hypothetical protein
MKSPVQNSGLKKWTEPFDAADNKTFEKTLANNKEYKYFLIAAILCLFVAISIFAEGSSSEDAKLTKVAFPFMIGGVLLLITSFLIRKNFKKDKRDRTSLILDGIITEKKDTQGEYGAFYYIHIDTEKVETDLSTYTHLSLGQHIRVRQTLHKAVPLRIDRVLEDGSLFPGNRPMERVIVKEIVHIKEIIKVKCPYCETLVENTLSNCPQCGGTIR